MESVESFHAYISSCASHHLIKLSHRAGIEISVHVTITVGEGAHIHGKLGVFMEVNVHCVDKCCSLYYVGEIKFYLCSYGN